MWNRREQNASITTPEDGHKSKNICATQIGLGGGKIKGHKVGW